MTIRSLLNRNMKLRPSTHNAARGSEATLDESPFPEISDAALLEIVAGDKAGKGPLSFAWVQEPYLDDAVETDRELEARKIVRAYDMEPRWHPSFV